MKQKRFWIKLVATALALHIVLILLSVLEVVIYSYFVDPGRDKAFYEAHAVESAPWISYTFGALLVFLLVRRFVRRYAQQRLLYALALPMVYAAIDLLLIAGMTTDGNMLSTQFLIGKAVKIFAALLAYFIYSKNEYALENTGANTRR